MIEREMGSTTTECPNFTIEPNFRLIFDGENGRKSEPVAGTGRSSRPRYRIRAVQK